MASQAYWILAIGVYFQLQAYTTSMFAIAMNEPSIMPIAFGAATILFIPLVLVSVYMLEHGFFGVVICTTIHLFLRFVVSYACITLKATFKDAN